MYHGGDMIMRVRRSKLNGAYTCTTLRQKPLGKYQFHRKKRDHMQYILGAANINSWDPDCKLLLSFLPSLAISPSHTVKWSRVQNFSPQSSGNRMFFPDIQSYCMAGISLQDFFVLKIRLQDIFFWNHLIPPPPPLLKSQIVGLL